jgi:hypothetical protein
LRLDAVTPRHLDQYDDDKIAQGLFCASHSEPLDKRAAALSIRRPADGWLLSYDCGRTPLNVRGLSKKIKKASGHSGGTATAHQLRHFAATQMVGCRGEPGHGGPPAGPQPRGVAHHLRRLDAPKRDLEVARELEGTVLGGDSALVGSATIRGTPATT